MLNGGVLQASQIDLQAGSSFTADNGALLEGNVDNAGSFGVAATDVRLSGNYFQGTGGSLEAGGGYELVVSGYAEIGGALVIPGDVPPPSPGTTTVAMTARAINGTFARHSLGYTLQLSSTAVDVTARPQIALNERAVPPGATLDVTGADFPYDSTASFYLGPVSGPPLGTAAVNVRGAFQGALVVPASTLPGTYELHAVDGTTIVKRKILVSSTA